MAKYTINPKPVTKPRKDGQNQSYFEFTTEEGKTYNAPVKAKVTTPEGTVITLAEAQADANVRREFVEALVAEHYANVQKGIQAQADKLASMTDEEKAAYKEQQRQAGLKGAEISKAKFDAMTDEEKAEYAKKQREAGLRGAAIMKEKVAKMSPEQKAEYDNKQREAGLKGARISAEKRANMTPEELQQEREEQSRRGKAYWESLTDEEREAHRNKSIAGNIQSALVVDEGFSL